MILLYLFSIVLGAGLIVSGFIIDKQATRIHKLIRQNVDLQASLTYAYNGDAEAALTTDFSRLTLHPATIEDGIIDLTWIKDE